jgi:hypothetical protein
MPITKFEFKPGINREATSYASEGGWYDCDKIRFRAGRPEVIGGWELATAQRFVGVCRVMHNWTLIDSKDCLALGTNKKFYIENGNTLYDVTPIRFTDTSPNNPITTGAVGTNTHTYTTSLAHQALAGDYVTLAGITTDIDGICTDVYTDPFITGPSGGSVVRVVTPAPHYAAAGDSVTFSGATTFDGITGVVLNAAHTIQEVVSPTEYLIEVTDTATTGFTTGGGSVTALYLSRLNREFEVVDTPSTTSFTFTTDTPCSAGAVAGGGASVTAAFQISIGFSFNITGGGWGAGAWSRLGWSDPVTSSVSGISMRIWSVDNYGEDLVFCTRDGPLYIWDATNGFNIRGVKIADLPNAQSVPEQVSIVRVTADRHVLAIGATNVLTTVFDPLLVRWSSQENFLDWAPRPDNTAGDLRIPMGSYTVAALVTRQETLVWTEHSLHSVQFVGPPFIFGIQTVAENTNIVGPNAAANVNNVTYWMGRDRFWVYSGRVQSLQCTVQRYIFERLNPEQAAQVYAAVNDAFTEITWFYPSKNSQSNDSYVTYNYGEDVWTYGTLDRTAWAMCPGRSNLPYATRAGDADDGMLLIHEVGYSDGTTNPPSAYEAYIESADFDIADGDKLTFMDRIIPDVTFDRSEAATPSMTVQFTGKKFPGQGVQSTGIGAVTQTVTVDQFTQQFWIRMRARQMRVKLVSYAAGVCWMMGALRGNIRLDGKQ